jgi:hypothetical protein
MTVCFTMLQVGLIGSTNQNLMTPQTMPRQRQRMAPLFLGILFPLPVPPLEAPYGVLRMVLRAMLEANHILGLPFWVKSENG